MKKEQNWRNKNDRPNKRFKYTEDNSKNFEDSRDAAEQTVTDQACNDVTGRSAILKQNDILNLKKAFDFNKKKRLNKNFRCTDPCLYRPMRSSRGSHLW